MKKKKNIEFKASYAFYIIVVLTLTVIIVSAAMGANQDKVYRQEWVSLNLAEKYLNAGKLDQAAPILANLAAKRPDSYLTQWYYGRCLAWQEDYGQAVQYFKKAQEIYPLIVRNFSYTFQMGESLYNIKEYNEAAKYLQVALLSKGEKSDKDKARKLLLSIEQNK